MTSALEAKHMVRGIRDKLRRVRELLTQEKHSVTVTSRLWNAEQQLARAEESITPDRIFNEAESED